MNEDEDRTPRPFYYWCSAGGTVLRRPYPCVCATHGEKYQVGKAFGPCHGSIVNRRWPSGLALLQPQ